MTTWSIATETEKLITRFHFTPSNSVERTCLKEKIKKKIMWYLHLTKYDLVLKDRFKTDTYFLDVSTLRFANSVSEAHARLVLVLHNRVNPRL